MNKKTKKQVSKTERELAQITLERNILEDTLKHVLERFDAKNLFDSLLSKVEDSLRIENHALEGSEYHLNCVKTGQYDWVSTKLKNKYLQECWDEIKQTKEKIKKITAVKNALVKAQNLYLGNF
jgi:hypothetical protein